MRATTLTASQIEVILEPKYAARRELLSEISGKDSLRGTDWHRDRLDLILAYTEQIRYYEMLTPSDEC